MRPDDDVSKEIGDDHLGDYIFVSHTRSQFETKDKVAEDAFKRRKALLQIGIDAAKAAGVEAFWLDCFPRIRGEEHMEDVYRICDIVRAAYSVTNAIDSSKSKFAGSLEKTLQGWGERLWTLPELVLSTSHRDIEVRDHANGTVISRHKRNLGYLAWDIDWQDAKQLADHYESTVHLTQLELISIANRCLGRRKTKIHQAGDYAYALMGLPRRRPQIVKSDSDFVAFARLSVSNTSDSIIERLLCMQPPKRDTPWHDMVDVYGAQLRDIEPLCQIADVDAHFCSETVVLDGVFGASICWSKLEPVHFLKRRTCLRRATRIVMPKSPFVPIIALLLLAIWAPIPKVPKDPKDKGPDLSDILHGIITISVAIFSSLAILAGPALLKNLYYGKFWTTQARFFGIQGLAHLNLVERSIFGVTIGHFNAGHLRWSTSGSLQSRGTKESKDQYYYERVKPVELPNQDDEGKHLFTLIDTYNLEATAFYADCPPTVVLVCG